MIGHGRTLPVSSRAGRGATSDADGIHRPGAGASQRQAAATVGVARDVAIPPVPRLGGTQPLGAVRAAPFLVDLLSESRTASTRSWRPAKLLWRRQVFHRVQRAQGPAAHLRGDPSSAVDVTVSRRAPGSSSAPARPGAARQRASVPSDAKERPDDGALLPLEKSGGVLLSQGVYPQVPSALAGLTAVFGMGTGVTPPPWPPETGCQSWCANHDGRQPHEDSRASTSLVHPSPRPISTGRLSTLLCVHLRPINVVV